MEKLSPDQDPSPAISPLEKKRLLWLLIVATLLFLFGIFLPMITVSKFIIVENTFSVISGVLELLRNGHLLLFIVVSGFSILLPLMKIGVLFMLLMTDRTDNSKTKRYLHLMHDYGRWAMLDVMVVAVLIVTVKLGAIASIKVHLGLYVFGAAALLIMLITHKVVHLANKSSGLRAAN